MTRAPEEGVHRPGPGRMHLVTSKGVRRGIGAEGTDGQRRRGMKEPGVFCKQCPVLGAQGRCGGGNRES